MDQKTKDFIKTIEDKFGTGVNGLASVLAKTQIDEKIEYASQEQRATEFIKERRKF